MSNHLLACTCGRHVSVSTSMAGESVRCVCGAQLDVPPLRELKQLPADEPAGGARGSRVWTDRHRLTFVFIVAALAAGALAGYLAVRLPEAPQLVSTGEVVSEANSPEQVMAAFDALRRGLVPDTTFSTAEAFAATQNRRAMFWGIRISLGVGACAVVAAVVCWMVSPAGKKR